MAPLTAALTTMKHYQFGHQCPQTINDDGEPTVTRSKFNFLALSSLATKYGVDGTDAVRRSLGLTGYTWKTSRLSSTTERALRQADKALSGSTSNTENIELQDLSGIVNSALHSTEQAETPLDEEQSKALTSINDQPLDTAWVYPAAREHAGLKKAMTGMRDGDGEQSGEAVQGQRAQIRS